MPKSVRGVRTNAVQTGELDSAVVRKAVKLKNQGGLPGLRAPTANAWKWDAAETWTPVGGGNVVMTVGGGMSLTMDEDGNWLLTYQVQTHTGGHTWLYAFEARSQYGTPLFTFAPSRLSKGPGSFDIVQTGRSADLRRDNAAIAMWVRRGIAGRA